VDLITSEGVAETSKGKRKPGVTSIQTLTLLPALSISASSTTSTPLSARGIKRPRSELEAVPETPARATPVKVGTPGTPRGKRTAKAAKGTKKPGKQKRKAPSDEDSDDSDDNNKDDGDDSVDAHENDDDDDDVDVDVVDHTDRDFAPKKQKKGASSRGVRTPKRVKLAGDSGDDDMD